MSGYEALRCALELLRHVRYGTDDDSIWCASYKPSCTLSVTTRTFSSGSRTCFEIDSQYNVDIIHSIPLEQRTLHYMTTRTERFATVNTPEGAFRIVTDGGRRFPTYINIEEECPRTATVYAFRNGSSEDRRILAATLIQAAYRGFKARLFAEHLRYAPGGTEYEKAAARFESACV